MPWWLKSAIGFGEILKLSFEMLDGERGGIHLYLI